MDPREIPLRDLHLPDAIGWWPLAPGWWLLIVLAVAALAWLAWRLAARRRRAAARRQALGQLESIGRCWAESGDAVGTARELSTLLRRAMLAYSPRSDVAGLTGDAWLHWLDRDLPDRAFTQGPGRCLLDLPYRNPASTGPDLDIDGLIGAVRQRLQTPVPGMA